MDCSLCKKYLLMTERQGVEIEDRYEHSIHIL